MIWYTVFFTVVAWIGTAHTLVPALTQLSSQEVPSASTKWQKRIEALRSEQQKAEIKLKEVRNRNDVLSETMHTLKRQLMKGESADQRFVNQKLTLMSQQHTVRTEEEEAIQRIIRLIDTIILALQEQEAATEKSSQPIQIEPEEKAITGYNDLIAAEQKVLEIKSLLAEANRNTLLINADISQGKQALDFAEDEYEQKHREKEQFIPGSGTKEAFVGFTAAQQGELTDLHEHLARDKRELAQTKVQEADHALEANKLSIERLTIQLSALEKSFSRIKKTVNITPDFIAEKERELDQHRQKSIADRQEINYTLHLADAEESKARKEGKMLIKEYQISPTDLLAIKSSDKKPKTIAEWEVVTQLLGPLTKETFHRIDREFVAAELAVDKALLRREELELLIIKSWRRMTAPDMQFKNEEEVEQEIKQYQLAKAEHEQQQASLAHLYNTAIKSLHELNVNFDKLKNLVNELDHSQRTLFANRHHEYFELRQRLERIGDQAYRCVHRISAVMERYTAALNIMQGSIKRTEAIIKELKLKSFWSRPQTSLLWTDFSKFLPDMAQFWDDLKIRTGQFFHALVTESFGTLQRIMGGLFAEPLRLILVVVNILLIITCYYVLKFYLPDIAYYLSSVGQGYWVIHNTCLGTAAFLLFIMHHLFAVYLWILLFILLSMAGHATWFLTYLTQIFYLATIPYALWLVLEMIQALRNTNKEKRYMLISEQAAPRVFGILAFMVSAWVTVFCVREAFVLGGYQNSRVPIVLGAALYLVGQVSLIALLSRSQILGLIRSDTPLWEWVYDHVNRYYYVVWLVVTATIVMFNPYIGYGKQVFYIIVRLVLTAALLSFFSWIHGTLKRVSIDLFFYYADRDVLKDRFSTARYWYAFFIVAALVLFLGSALYFSSRIWGMALSWNDMLGWLNRPFHSSFDKDGRPVSVTVLSLVSIVCYVLVGFLGAYLVNRFIVARVLDPVIVESGVQSTVSTLLRYVFIAVALFMGLSNEGLGDLTTKIAILLAGVSFAVQDTVRDFISYFVLLVQRPVKVGDFIRVLDNLSDNENVSLMGFVRSITPRSIVIRKRNSTTVIIPNSRVVMNPVMNWSYTRGFFAFDDMRITVPYSADPLAIRELIFNVLDKNPNILKNPSPIVRLDDFVDNGYLFLVRAFLTTHKIGEQWDIAAEVRINIVKVLREHNIEIASPIRTLRISHKDSSLFPPSVSSV